MGKKTLWTGIIVGAALGGLVSLFNEDARNYVKDTARKSKDHLTYYTKNPQDAVGKLKQAVEGLNDVISNNSGSALNALDQVENSLNKWMKK